MVEGANWAFLWYRLRWSSKLTSLAYEVSFVGHWSLLRFCKLSANLNFSSLQGLQQTLQTLQKLRLGTERVRRGYGAGPALNGKRESFSNLFFYPSHQYCYRILLFFSCQLSSGRYMMPFEETSATTAACSMLGYKYWMSSHRRLLAVIGYNGWSKAFGNKILCMLTDGCQALFCNIFLIPLRKVKTAAECWFGKSFKQIRQVILLV